ncbi:MAG: hypothetical protein IT250_14645 [Chitinophagaceae bacterium]|nr:hypothetical protein [Chitinophagaceae bacterium]
MKKIFLLAIVVFVSLMCFAQKPSKEQMAADKKKYEEAKKNLNKQLESMSPEARKSYDSLMNAMGMGQKINDAEQKVNNSSAYKQPKQFNGLVPAKDNKVIAAISITPTVAGMGNFIKNVSEKTLAAANSVSKNNAYVIYMGLISQKATSTQTGSAAMAMWLSGKTETAICMMAQACKDDPENTDNLNNYASMLSMMGAPEFSIPILNNLNARFKKNSTLLNNLGQAWFALGDIDKADKYLDSTLALNASNAQANETMCLIDQSKGRKAQAIAHAKAAMKSGYSKGRADMLKKLGYTPVPGDYNNFPPASKSDDLLNLGGFSMPAFPTSAAECKVLKPIWKQFRADIDKRLTALQKIADESNKKINGQLEEMQKHFMNAKNKTLANPGSVSQAEAMNIVKAPLFAEKMALRENIVLQNLQNKKQAAIKAIFDYQKGEGASLKKKYDEAIKKANDKLKDVGEGSSVDEDQICHEKLKATDEFLSKYNEKLEGLYNEYLSAEKQLLNEFSYSSLYSTYQELLPGINAGLQSQWLRALSLTQNGFNFQSLELECADDDADGKGGKLTAFKDPNCNINSDFSQTLGVANLGFSIKLDCSGMTTTFNALIMGVKLTQDLDHAGFGDSFKKCTVSIGPKTGFGGKVGPLEASVNVGMGADIEFDNTGITDVVVKAGAEVESGLHNSEIPNPGNLGTAASGSAGVEGRISLITGAGSIQGTGMFQK